jgi:hypothetical protein
MCPFIGYVLPKMADFYTEGFKSDRLLDFAKTESSGSGGLAACSHFQVVFLGKVEQEFEDSAVLQFQVFIDHNTANTGAGYRADEW